MIIEFFGFPGSGKTTISNEVIKELENQNHSVTRGTFDHKSTTGRISLKFYYSLCCALIAPLYYMYNFKFFIKSQGIKGFKDFLNITYLYARYQIYKSSKKVVVFDQGLVQAYFSVASFNPEYLKYNYEKIVGISNCVVILDLPIEEVFKRIEQRGTQKSRVETDKKVDFNFIAKQFVFVKKILNKKKNSFKQVTLNAERRIVDNVDFIIGEIFNR